MKVKIVKLTDFYPEAAKKNPSAVFQTALEILYEKYTVIANHEHKGEKYFIVKDEK